MIAYVGKEVYSGKPRGSPEKTARNAGIMDLYRLGESYRSIARAYRIDHSRVAQIVKRLTMREKSSGPVARNVLRRKLAATL